MFGQNRNCGPVSIVGSVHTGTTLLRNILDRHPELFMAQGESHFFENRKKIERSYPDLRKEEILKNYVKYIINVVKLGVIKGTLKSEDHTFADIGVSFDDFRFLLENAGKAVHANPGWPHVAVFLATMASLAKLSGKTRWGEKTPAHVFFIDPIVTMIPNVRIIEIVRDPRAVLASRKARSTEEWRESRTASGAIMNEILVFDPTLDSYKWRSVIHAGTLAKRKYHQSVLRIRYEDLVQEPAKTIEEICQFIGLRFDARMLQVSWVNNATSIVEPNNSKGIGTDAMEKWRKSLTAGEISIAQVILRREMNVLGYVPMNVGIAGLREVPSILAKTSVNVLKHLRALIVSRDIPQSKWRRIKRVMELLIKGK